MDSGALGAAGKERRAAADRRLQAVTGCWLQFTFDFEL